QVSIVSNQLLKIAQRADHRFRLLGLNFTVSNPLTTKSGNTRIEANFEIPRNKSNYSSPSKCFIAGVELAPETAIALGRVAGYKGFNTLSKAEKEQANDSVKELEKITLAAVKKFTVGVVKNSLLNIPHNSSAFSQSENSCQVAIDFSDRIDDAISDYKKSSDL
ncbi:MAG: hypothetical protein OXC40_03855, partial [Proteobacteria bacterium]|nr:hypothetical protein [Pseudomonadota bacterium]